MAIVIKDPAKVEFSECILTVITARNVFERECERVYLEENEFTTLKDITDDYPNVKIVIAEGPLSGKIYRYGNHKANTWEKVGTMEGYA